MQQRGRADLYHAALQVYVPEGQFVIEQAPAWGASSKRGVVAEGTVGTRAAWPLPPLPLRSAPLARRHCSRHCRGGGESTTPQATNPNTRGGYSSWCRKAPAPVRGRDKLGAGEMWSAYSMISWLIARTGLDAASIQPPRCGRAPGWRAGIIVADNHEARSLVKTRARCSAWEPAGIAVRSTGAELESKSTPVTSACSRRWPFT